MGWHAQGEKRITFVLEIEMQLMKGLEILRALGKRFLKYYMSQDSSRILNMIN